MFWETKFGQELDKNIASTRKWMYAMLVVSTITAIGIVVSLFKKK